MMIPDLTGLSSATDIFGESPSEALQPADLTKITKTWQQFGREGSLQASTGIPQHSVRRRTSKRDHQHKRAVGDCYGGQAYYVCSGANGGYTGCCHVDACQPGGCPDGDGLTSSTSSTKKASSTKSATQTRRTSQAQSTSRTQNNPQTQRSSQPQSSTQTQSTSQAQSNSQTQATTRQSSIDSSTSEASGTSATPSSSQATTSSQAVSTAASTSTGAAFETAPPTGTMTASSTSSTASAAPAPSCPAGNGTTYNDTSHVAYKIHCGVDNTYSSYYGVQVSTGGYSECFTACSDTEYCAGFTFVGTSSGLCYLKNDLPSYNYTTQNGTNHITAAKVDFKPVATSRTPKPSDHQSGRHLGTIVGATIGGVVAFVLLLVLIALITRHRRKKLEEKHAATGWSFKSPTETLGTSSAHPTLYGRGHGRSGSTAHDAFAPFGGFYRGSSSAQADQYTQAQAEADRARFTPDRLPPSIPPGMRAEYSEESLPSSSYKTYSNPSKDEIAMLDGTPIKRPPAELSPDSASRSSIFMEHLELEDTSLGRPPPQSPGTALSPKTPGSDSDSPTLGRAGAALFSLADEVRRRRYLLSWSSPDAAQGEEHEMSPTLQPRAQIVTPDISKEPMDSQHFPSPLNTRGMSTGRY